MKKIYLYHLKEMPLQKEKLDLFISEPELYIAPNFLFLSASQTSSVDTNIYTLADNLIAWDMYGDFFRDYLAKRAQMRLIVLSNYNSLSIDEKVIACKYYLTNQTERNLYLTKEEQRKYWDEFIDNTYNCRVNRWNNARKYISYELDMASSFDLALSTRQLSDLYITYGIESKAIDGITGLYDYIEGTADYSGSGFPSKPYYSEELKNNLICILKDGDTI